MNLGGFSSRDRFVVGGAAGLLDHSFTEDVVDAASDGGLRGCRPADAGDDDGVGDVGGLGMEATIDFLVLSVVALPQSLGFRYL